MRTQQLRYTYYQDVLWWAVGLAQGFCTEAWKPFMPPNRVSSIFMGVKKKKIGEMRIVNNF